MFGKKLGDVVEKKLSKLGICLGLAGVSATAVACYGPPADLQYVRSMEDYAAMCDGGSCEQYCQQNSCNEFGYVQNMPCNYKKFTNMEHEGMLYICNDRWRIEAVDCHGHFTRVDGQDACDESVADESSEEAPGSESEN